MFTKNCGYIIYDHLYVYFHSNFFIPVSHALIVNCLNYDI